MIPTRPPPGDSRRARPRRLSPPLPSQAGSRRDLLRLRTTRRRTRARHPRRRHDRNAGHRAVVWPPLFLWWCVSTRKRLDGSIYVFDSGFADVHGYTVRCLVTWPMTRTITYKTHSLWARLLPVARSAQCVIELHNFRKIELDGSYRALSLPGQFGGADGHGLSGRKRPTSATRRPINSIRGPVSSPVGTSNTATPSWSPSPRSALATASRRRK